MPESVSNESLGERSQYFRKHETIGRYVGGLSVVAAGVDALVMIVTHKISGVAIGLETGSLWFAYLGNSIGVSAGRSADVIDAELLQRSRTAQDTIPTER